MSSAAQLDESATWRSFATGLVSEGIDANAELLLQRVEEECLHLDGFGPDARSVLTWLHLKRYISSEVYTEAATMLRQSEREEPPSAPLPQRPAGRACGGGS